MERIINPIFNIHSTGKYRKEMLENPYRYVSSVVDNRLISYYRLDGDATDSVGLNDGNETSITYDTGVNGLGAVFNGTNTPKIQIYSPTDDFSFTDGINDKPFTISFFVKFNVVANSWLVNKRDLTNAEYSIYYNAGLMTFIKFGGVTSIYLVRRINISPTSGVWYHITVTDSAIGSPIGINCYVNGVNANGATLTSGLYSSMKTTTAPLEFGNPSYSTSLNLNGVMDGVGIFNKELTPTEVLDNYNLQLTQELA